MIPPPISERIILDLCGGSGAWSAPYHAAGYDVRIIDPVRNGKDVRLMERPIEPIHGILCAPPCQHFARSGARWWPEKGDKALLEALSISDACLRIVWATRPKWWALENPVGRLSTYIGPPRMTFDPNDFGADYTKRTWLWGDFSMPFKINRKHPQRVNATTYMPKSKRSITPAGFAYAFFKANP